jgi:hypothetical protein
MPVSNGAYIGEILGLQLTGYLVNWYGNKKVMTGATVLMIAFVSSGDHSRRCAETIIRSSSHSSERPYLCSLSVSNSAVFRGVYTKQ